MSFDIDTTLKDMVEAFLGILKDEVPNVKKCMTDAILEEKQALKEIWQARLSGEIDDDEMQSQLEDEKTVLKGSLLVCKIQAKAMIQKALNTAMKVFEDAIKVVLGV